MNPFSDTLHKTPWWLLLGGGLALFIALAVYVTPFHVIGQIGRASCRERV